MSNHYIPAKQVKCPRCGQPSLVDPGTSASGIHCSGCGLLLRAQPPSPGGAKSDAKAGFGMMEKIKSWLDIHHLHSPDELKIPGTAQPRATDSPEGDAPGGFDANELPAIENASRDGHKRKKPAGRIAKVAAEGVVALPAGWWKRHRVTLEESKQTLREEGKLKAPLPKWMFAALTAGGCLALAGTVLWLVYATATSSGRWRETSQTPAVQDKSAPGTEAIQTMVEDFLKARNTEARLAFVRDPERVRPQVDNFHPQVGKGEVLSVMPFNTLDNRGLLAAQFLVTFEDKRRRTVCVVRTPEGVKIDWEAYSTQGEATYSEMKAGLAAPAAIRVVASPGAYYNYAFADENQWLAFELNNGDWETGFTGYVRRSDPLAKRLQATVEMASGAAPVTLRVSVDAAGGARGQCIINEMLETGWVEGVDADKAARSRNGLDGT